MKELFWRTLLFLWSAPVVIWLFFQIMFKGMPFFNPIVVLLFSYPIFTVIWFVIFAFIFYKSGIDMNE